MAALVEKIRHEGTLPGKTLRRYRTVTSSYLLHSSFFTLRDSDVELESAVAFVNGRLGPVGFTFEVADASTVGINIEDHAVTVMHHFPHGAQHFTYISNLNGHAD